MGAHRDRGLGGGGQEGAEGRVWGMTGYVPSASNTAISHGNVRTERTWRRRRGRRTRWSMRIRGRKEVEEEVEEEQ